MKKTTPSRRPRTALIGAGNLAQALIPGLVAAGYPITAVAARGLASARSAARLAGGAVALVDPIAASRGADLILLAVPDSQIGPLALRLARSDLRWQGRTVLHHAGALSLAPLAPLRRAGARVGILHPLQCLGSTPMAATVLRGSHARLEGGAGVRRLARDLGLRPLPFRAPLTPSRRSAYHAAAALLSNDLLALLSVGTQLLESTGLGRRAALRGLATLATGTLAQAEAGGLGAALTGPVVRGDRETVEAHLRRLARLEPQLAEVHRLLSLRLLKVAEAEGVSPAGELRAQLERGYS